MKKKFPVMFSVGLALFVLLACSSPLALLSTQTPTPGLVSISGSAGAGGGGAGSAGGAGGAGSGSKSGPLPPAPNPGLPATATEPPRPNPVAGPYVVKQTVTLGGEKISGQVCSLTAPFTVNSVTPKTSFVFVFVPTTANRGNVSYAYSIPSAGESHDAKGTYTISQASPDGTLTLYLAVSDHVVFKGFDGNIPNRYQFNLVLSGNTPCPGK